MSKYYASKSNFFTHDFKKFTNLSTEILLNMEARPNKPLKVVQICRKLDNCSECKKLKKSCLKATSNLNDVRKWISRWADSQIPK